MSFNFATFITVLVVLLLFLAIIGVIYLSSMVDNRGTVYTITPYQPPKPICTETLDRLYLELSQVTQARTRREYAYEKGIIKALKLTVPGSAVGGILRSALKDGGSDEG